MLNIKLLAAGSLTLATALAATTASAITVSPVKPATTTIVLDIQSAQYSLDPGEFKGFDASGKRQRVRIRTAGNGYTLQTLSGRNSGQVFYVHSGGNIYRAQDGTTLEVTGRRSAVWNGWLGRIALND